jgi:hypothetical protein
MIVLGALFARAKGWRPAGAFTLGIHGWLVNGLALAYGVIALVNMVLPRSPNDPWCINYVMLITTIGILVLGGVYMVIAQPYERGMRPPEVRTGWTPRNPAARHGSHRLTVSMRAAVASKLRNAGGTKMA